MQFVVLLIPYASIISKSKSKSTGETIVQLSYSWSSLVGMVRLSCFLYVKFGLMSVLQWCGKFSPVKLNLEADSAEKVCYSSSTFPLSTETWRVCPGCGCYRSAVRWIDLTAACMSHNSNNNKKDNFSIVSYVTWLPLSVSYNNNSKAPLEPAEYKFSVSTQCQRTPFT